MGGSCWGTCCSDTEAATMNKIETRPGDEGHQQESP